MTNKLQEDRIPSLWVSFIPIISLMLLLSCNILLFKDGAASGPNQLALFISASIASAIGMLHLKVSYATIEKQIMINLNYSLHAIIILIVVGALISLWMMAGIVPGLIYYGLKLLNPSIFLPISCIICTIVSLATGSSWSTTGTIGVALMGIGQVQGINPGLVAGSIISGAYFGDKMSPLSDTTNLAPAMAGVDLFTHIRHMTYTSIPAYIISLIMFSIIGLSLSSKIVSTVVIDDFLKVLDTHFQLGPHIFIIPTLVLILVAKKTPALVALVLGSTLAAISIPIFQKDLLHNMFIQLETQSTYKLIVQVAANGLSFDTKHPMVNQLINRGGMVSMLNTVWLIIAAMVFGGTMEGSNMLKALGQALLKCVHSVFGLISATVGCCISTNILACDQYIAIVLPGRMFKESFDKFNLEEKNLSRTLEDAGTVTSVLVPWNSCGAYHAGILGISTFTYLPYCFFNFISPIMAIFLAYTGWTIYKKKKN